MKAVILLTVSKSECDLIAAEGGGGAAISTTFELATEELFWKLTVM